MSIHKNGQVATVETSGNPDCHLILRGGREPNYDAAGVAAAVAELAKAKLPTRLMVDFSHANSSKQYAKQMDVCANVAGQIAGGKIPGNSDIMGVMIESHL
jgi:3-deoxy-7-phosphoheptulonate synthase